LSLLATAAEELPLLAIVEQGATNLPRGTNERTARTLVRPAQPDPAGMDQLPPRRRVQSDLPVQTASCYLTDPTARVLDPDGNAVDLFAPLDG
jgi:hypothetical protein